MSVIEQLISHKAKLKSELRKLNLEALQKLRDNINNIVEELETEKLEIAKKQDAAISRINELKEQMMATARDAGVSLDDTLTQVKGGLAAAKGGANKVTRTVKAKYRVIVDGETFEWTGRGKAPKVFAPYKLKGTLDTLLIKD